MTAPASILIRAGDVVHYNPTPGNIRAGMSGGCRDALVLATYPTPGYRAAMAYPTDRPTVLWLLVDVGNGETVEAMSPYGPAVGSALMPGCWHAPSWWLP